MLQTTSKTSILILILLISGLSLSSKVYAEGTSSFDPLGMILSWQQDPLTTMTIDWHTGTDDTNSTLVFREKGGDEWQIVSGGNRDYPYSERLIHRVELTGLSPDTMYEFRVGDYTRVRFFRTMPETADRPIRFASGGDVRHRIEWMDEMNRRVVKYDPDFIVWGGDLAYANGQPDRNYRWFDFMDSVMNTLIAPDGRQIPILASIGNHEVKGGYYWREDRAGTPLPEYEQNDEIRAAYAPYYYELFAFPGQPGYGALDFGDYMSIILLDTDHTNPIEGQQSEWLEQTLAERTHMPHVFPTYHVPAFPSVRSPEGDLQVKVRENFVPLFEEYGVRVAFENHDHVYKRTFPIRNGQIDPTGVIYLGDGNWGVSSRPLGRDHDGTAWYLKRAKSQRGAIIGTIHGVHQHFLMISIDGEVIDEYPATPHTDLNTHSMAIPWQQESAQ